VLERYPVPCEPPRWARGGHAQTLLGHVLPSRGAPVAERGARRLEIELSDGERLVVYHLPAMQAASAVAGQAANGVRVHLLHGLSGDVDADYMRRTAAVLHAAGYDLWLVNHRGCGAGAGLARRPYHSGKTEDLQDVLRASRAHAPGLAQLVVGFSLSGNLALLHAAQDHALQPDGVVAVNPPVDLARATRDMGRGLSRLYQLRFLHRLRRAVRERDGRPCEVPLFASMLAFDDGYTAPVAGFGSGSDYYARCSALPRLGAVRRPAVILTAEDDPFVDPQAYRGVTRAEGVFLHLEPTGGHVGYLARRGLGYAHWLDGALAHYVSELARGVAKQVCSPATGPMS